MINVQYSNVTANITCSECKNNFRANVGNPKLPWQNYIFNCPVCNQTQCIPREKIIKYSIKN